METQRQDYYTETEKNATTFKGGLGILGKNNMCYYMFPIDPFKGLPIGAAYWPKLGFDRATVLKGP